jgi:hypothetical protein
MAQTNDIELVNGVYRVWDRRDEGSYYCESGDQVLARKWLAAAAGLNGIEALPEGVTIGSTTCRQINFTRKLPIGFDYHWVREIALDILRGTTGLRLDSDATAEVSANLNSEFESRVRMENGRLRLELRSGSGRKGSFGVKAVAGVKTEVSGVTGSDSLLKALAGIHPIEWVRKMLAAGGSADWRDLAGAVGIRTWQLDRLYTKWQLLSARSEAALWRALGDGSELAELRRVVEVAAAGGLPVPKAGSAAEEWLISLGSNAASDAAKSLLIWLDDSSMLASAARLRQYALDVLDPSKLTDWAAAALVEQAGGEWNTLDTTALLARWTNLTKDVYAKTSEALNRKLSAELTGAVEASGGERVVLDVSFPATTEGAGALRTVAAGGLDAALATGADTVIHEGWIEAFLARRRYLDLNLPFVGRRQYRHDLDALASAKVANDGLGRLVVYALDAKDKVVENGVVASTLLLAAAVSARDGDPRCDNLSLTFEHRFPVIPGRNDAAWNRVLDAYGLKPDSWPEEKGEAILTAAAPGDLVLAWTRTPHPSSREFEAAILRVSTALQTMMRTWLPALYFAKPENYQDLGAARPLLVYAAGRPYQSSGRRDYTYDVMDKSAVAAAASSALPNLPSLLAEAREKLIAAGLMGKVRHYEPTRPDGVICDALRRPQFKALLSADTFLIQDMIRLAKAGRDLRSAWAKNPRVVVNRLSTDGAYFVKSFHSRLRRLYGGNEILGLSSLVLVEATAALAGVNTRCEAQLEWVNEKGERMFWTRA